MLRLLALCILMMGDSFAISAQSDPAQLCNRISQIKRMPFHKAGPEVDYSKLDKTYDEFRKAGSQVIPCLVQKITDKTPMPDPRQAPIYSAVRVGDVAFWLLNDIADVPFEAMLPEPVQEEMRTRGVYAYFGWVKHDRNRRILQNNVRKWLEAHP